MLEGARACWDEYLLDNLVKDVENIRKEWIEVLECKLKVLEIGCTVLQLFRC